MHSLNQSSYMLWRCVLADAVTQIKDMGQPPKVLGLQA